jgi:hypothetical protein
MGRYHFNIKCEDRLVQDLEGSDLPDLAAAQQEALEVAREILANAIRQGQEPTGNLISVTDENGHELAIVPLADAIPSTVKRLLH